MDQRTPPELLATEQDLQRENNVVDQAGHRIVALLREAADAFAENAERAMTMAHKASMELRAAEERIAVLDAEVERLRDRATRAEGWLEAIKQEVENKLIAAMEANRPELPALHYRVSAFRNDQWSAMQNERDPAEKFPTPIREPKPGTFQRPAHGLGSKCAPAAAELRLSGPMTGEQKLGEGLRELPLGGKAEVDLTKSET